MTLCLLPYTLSLFVAQQGWLSCYYLKMNYNIIISTCSYCIVCIIHKDLLFILFFLIYNRIGLSPICVIRTYVCPNMDNWTDARCDSCPWSVSGTKIRWGTEGGVVMFRYNRTITKNLVNKGYFFYFSSNDNKFINRQNFR